MSTCEYCGGRGHHCIDDLCQSGECMHGDVCEVCGGEGIYDDYDEDDEADQRFDCEREERD